MSNENDIVLEINFSPKKPTSKPFQPTTAPSFSINTTNSIQEPQKPLAPHIKLQREIQQKFANYSILLPYSTKLQINDIALTHSATMAKNKYYELIVYQKKDFTEFGLLSKWGKVGGDCDYHYEILPSREEAIGKFKQKFSEKTFNDWDERENFNAVPGAYTMLSLNFGGLMSQGEDNKKKFDDLRRRLEDKERLDLIGKKMVSEISELGYEVAMVLREIFSIALAKGLMAEIGVDPNKLSLGELKMRHITHSHQILSEIENELCKNSKRFQRLMELSHKMNSVLPIVFKKSSSVKIIDDILKLKEFK
jgi:poly [ADP-ribose] polymerase